MPDAGAQQRPVRISSNPVRCDRRMNSVPPLPLPGPLPGQLAGPSSPANMPIERLGPSCAEAFAAPAVVRICQRSAVKLAVASTVDPPEAAGYPMRQRLVVADGRNNRLTGRQAQRARSRAFRRTGNESLLIDASMFAGGQLSGPAIQQILVRSHDSCTSDELNSYAAERATKCTLAPRGGR